MGSHVVQCKRTKFESDGTSNFILGISFWVPEEVCMQDKSLLVLKLPLDLNFVLQRRPMEHKSRKYINICFDSFLNR